MLGAGVLVAALAGLASPCAAFDEPNSAVLTLRLGFGFDRGLGEDVSVPDDPKLDFGPKDQMTLNVWVKLLDHAEVYHILGLTSSVPHPYTSAARITGGLLSYAAPGTA